MAGVDYVLAKHPIDRKKVAVIGHSYGGFMTNWLITQYPDRFAAAASGAGIANWTSDYANSDIPRTKETEFWGPPSDPKARETMIRQSPITYANRDQDADAVHQWRDRPPRAVLGERAALRRDQEERRSGEDDPVRGTAARHRRLMEQRSSECSTSGSGSTNT